MKRPGVLLAAVVVIGADAVALIEAAYNRSGPPLATIELSERELRLERPQRESTALMLRLAWEPAYRGVSSEDGPGWFDRTKLEELGYDCRLPATDPAASAHYRASTAKPAFVVLELRDGGAAGEARLWAADAGRDLAELRRKHPDAQRFLIVPGLVRLIYNVKWDYNARKELPGAYLRGVVGQLLVGEISVPPSEQAVFGSLSPTSNLLSPRYAVVLHYGRNHEPWIASSRLLGK